MGRGVGWLSIQTKAQGSSLVTRTAEPVTNKSMARCVMTVASNYNKVADRKRAEADEVTVSSSTS